MLLRDYLIIIVMIGIIITAGALIIGDLSEKYNIEVDTSFNQTYNKINEVNNLAKSLEDSIGGETKTATLGILDVIINGAWKSLKMLSKTGVIIKSMLDDIGTKYNIPPIYITGLVIIVGIGIIFGLLSAVFRRKI